jgi:hypothetical protein
MRYSVLALAVVTTIAVGGAGTAVHSASGFEKNPVFQAKDLVAPELLKGPHFTVDSRVPVKEFLYRFSLRTDYGIFQVHGAHMLQIRVREVYAIAQLEDMSKTKEFADAAARAVARPVTSTVHMLMNPVQTVEGLPSGIDRLFGRIELGAEQVATAATAPGQSTGQQMESATERVGSITVTALGYEKERRDLAKSLGVDPYTTNPVLSKKLSDMAWVAFSGRFGIQAAMTVLVPYSTAMSMATITNSTVYDVPQADLINADRAIFATTGATDAQVSALMKNRQYSATVLTSLAVAIQRLKGVNGLASIVRFGAIAGVAQREEFKAPARTVWVSGQVSRLADKELVARAWRVYESFSNAAER